MRAHAILAALLAILPAAVGHPLCYIDAKPTDLEQVLSFCPAAQDGACCTDQEEAQVQARFEAAGPLTGDCEDLYKQVSCTAVLLSEVLLRTTHHVHKHFEPTGRRGRARTRERRNKHCNKRESGVQPRCRVVVVNLCGWVARGRSMDSFSLEAVPP